MTAAASLSPDRERRGFALLAVLWVIVGMSALALAGSLAARGAVASAQNRRALAVARWRAEGCLERARAAADDAMRDDGARPSGATGAPWLALDGVVAASLLVRAAGCGVTLRPAGDAVDVNAADATQLGALFLAAGADSAQAGSLAEALLDWRDDDTIPRTSGAEKRWYRGRNRVPPRDGALADVRELRLVRGFESGELKGVPLDSILTTEPGRVVLARAPPAVVASLPGMTAETVARVAELRLRGQFVGDLLALGGFLSRASRDSLTAHYSELVALTSPEPEAWIATARSTVDEPAPVTASVELRLVRAGTRVATVRRRSVQ